MSDEPTIPAESSPVTTTAPGPISVPAVHSDTLWDGPRWLENAGPEPVYVETKQQYWDLLNRRGLQMKDQQESRTGPSRDPADLELFEPPPPSLEIVAPAPFTKDEAELFYALEAVLARYRMLETLWCRVCFAANRPHGCRTTVNGRRIRVECRCGVREYQGLTGTTDLPTSLANQALTAFDHTIGQLITAGVPVAVQTVLLSDQDAKILRQYGRMLEDRNLEARRWCRQCWQNRLADETVIQEQMSEAQIVLACRCMIRFFQGTRY